MTDLDKIKAYIKTYLKFEEGSAWFDHHIRMTQELFERAKEKNPNLTWEEYLIESKKPFTSKRRGR